MGYICFKCKKTVGVDIRVFFSHLRRIHNVNSSSRYFECCQTKCHRTFNYIRSFKRHLAQHHIEVKAGESIQAVDMSEVMQERNIQVIVSQPHEEEDDDTNISDELEWDELEQDAVTDRVALFLAKLRAKSSMTLSTVSFVVNETSSLVFDLVSDLQKKTMSFLQRIGQSETPEGQRLNQCFVNAAVPFQNLETEHKQMKYFAQTGYFVQPVEQPLPGVSYTQQRDSKTGIVKQIAVRDTFHRIPLRPLLKLILESPGTMEKIVEWKRKLCDTNSLDETTVMKTSADFLTELFVPLLLYSDDCEVVNPLGSKTSLHKLGFIYFTLKCFPQQCLSRLDSHFLLAVYKADDAKTYGIDAVLESVVADIKDLESNGVEVNTHEFKGTLKVRVVQICGDNLGLNSILGYTESFSGNSVCRWCHVKKLDMRRQTMEDPSLQRNKESHLSDLAQNNPSETGLKRQSVLNNLKYFHVVDNVAPDVMHDILEGVGVYEAKLVLGSLISQKVITLDQVNYRITSYDYGFCDSANKPSTIRPHELKMPDSAMKQTAAQMWCLLRVLPLMIGDLIPEGNMHWELLLCLLTCMEYIFSPSLTQEAVIYLKYIIEEHHSLFLELFPEKHLKPKHHFMLHYPGAIKKLGPLVHYWCMRFEAKHGFFKRLGHVTCNFRNICKTMAFRHQMLLCYNVLSDQMFQHQREVGPGFSVPLSSIEEFGQISHRFQHTPVLADVYIPSWVKWQGTHYRPGMTLIVSHSPDGEPHMGTIQKIVVFESVIKFIVKNWDTIGFERHYFSYSVCPSTVIDCVDIDSIDDFHPLHVVRSYKEGDNSHYVSMRYRLF